MGNLNGRGQRRSVWSVLCALVLLAGCTGADQTNTAHADSSAAALAGAVEAQPQDSVIVEETLARARAQRLDTLPIGRIVASLGRTFVGAPYVPGTLELEGPERLIVNLREFDCVTFVESMLAMARVLRSGNGGYHAFQQELLRIRYRNGELSGYPSRLHYFSEWLADNQAKDIVQIITPELGGEADHEPINFMSQHVSAYRQLSDTAALTEVVATERRLSATPRYVIPENQIAAVANRIQDGDVIAAASTLPGLDVAHTGVALWVDGRLHLMHAPLVGKAVEISQLPLAERIQSIEKQDGIMVARPK
ncbi:MAG: N-acetylmuramoyl-L-alanine amidase-like domain-containing protein [Longimicrobiales bacterium]